jgi:hypothetical protein
MVTVEPEAPAREADGGGDIVEPALPALTPPDIGEADVPATDDDAPGRDVDPALLALGFDGLVVVAVAGGVPGLVAAVLAFSDPGLFEAISGAELQAAQRASVNIRFVLRSWCCAVANIEPSYGIGSMAELESRTAERSCTGLFATVRSLAGESSVFAMRKC